MSSVDLLFVDTTPSTKDWNIKKVHLRDRTYKLACTVVPVRSESKTYLCYFVGTIVSHSSFNTVGQGRVYLNSRIHQLTVSRGAAKRYSDILHYV